METTELDLMLLTDMARLAKMNGGLVKLPPDEVFKIVMDLRVLAVLTEEVPDELSEYEQALATRDEYEKAHPFLAKQIQMWAATVHWWREFWRR